MTQRPLRRAWRTTLAAWGIVARDGGMLAMAVALAALITLAVGAWAFGLAALVDATADDRATLLGIGLATAIFLAACVAAPVFMAPVGAIILLAGTLPRVADPTRHVALVMAGTLLVVLMMVFLQAAIVAAAPAADGRTAARAGLRRAWRRRMRLLQWATLGPFILGPRYITHYTTPPVEAFLGVPAIIHEDLGPYAAARRSGELLHGVRGMARRPATVAGLLVAIALLPAAAALMWIGALAGGPVAALAVGAAATLVVALGGASIDGVMRAAVYAYATTGALHPPLAEPRRRSA